MEACGIVEDRNVAPLRRDHREKTLKPEPPAKAALARA